MWSIPSQTAQADNKNTEILQNKQSLRGIKKSEHHFPLNRISEQMTKRICSPEAWLLRTLLGWARIGAGYSSTFPVIPGAGRRLAWQGPTGHREQRCPRAQHGASHEPTQADNIVSAPNLHVCPGCF